MQVFKVDRAIIAVIIFCSTALSTSYAQSLCLNLFLSKSYTALSSYLEPWEIGLVPRYYWNVKENRRRYLEWLGRRLGYKNPDDWYKITIRAVKENNGGTLVANYYDSSPYRMLVDLMPEHKFLPWKFGKTNGAFWREPQNIRLYLEWLGVQLGYKNLEDWYSVQQTDFKKFNGGGLITIYTPRELLKIAFPDYEWIPWKFSVLGIRFWNNLENRKAYIQWLGRELNKNKLEDWYSITMSDFHNNSGAGFIDYYGNSILKALSETLHEFQFEKWRFEGGIRGKWDLESQRKFLNVLMEKLELKDLEEWNHVSKKNVEDLGGGYLINRIYNGSLVKMLSTIYPEHNWKTLEKRNISQGQLRLQTVIEQLFPDSNIFINYKHPDLRFTNTSRKMELDIYIPDLKLAFEYQGEQHYRGVVRWGGEEAHAKTVVRDNEKIKAAKENGITLVIVSYGWDRRVESLSQLIEHALIESDHIPVYDAKGQNRLDVTR